MPILSVYLGSSVVSLGLIYSQSDKQQIERQNDVFYTFPYPLLNFYSHTEKETFLSSLIYEFINESAPQLDKSTVDIRYVTLFDNTVKHEDKNLLYVSELYQADVEHIFCSNFFYMHGGKAIYANPYPRHTTDIYNEEEKINILSNLQVYPFNFPADEFSQSLYDDGILYLQNAISPKPVHKKNEKNKKEHFKHVKNLVFTGDRFTYVTQNDDSIYYLALSLLDEYGVFSIKIDKNNISTHALNYAKSFTTLTDQQTNNIVQNSESVIDAGTFVKFVGAAECLFESDVNTKQLFQLEPNQIQIIPLELGKTAKVTLKGNGFDTVETQVTGGKLGVVFYNFEQNTNFFAGLQFGNAKEIKSAIRENLAKF